MESTHHASKRKKPGLRNAIPLAGDVPGLDISMTELNIRHSAPVGTPKTNEAAIGHLAKVTSVNKIRFLRRIQNGKRLSRIDLQCAIVIVDYFNAKKGRAWPSYTLLCGETGASRPSVARSVAKLDKLGIICREGGHKGRSNSYVPNFTAADMQYGGADSLTRDTTSADTPSQPRHSNSLTCDTESVSPMRPNTVTTPRSKQRRGVVEVTERTALPVVGAVARETDRKDDLGLPALAKEGREERAGASAPEGFAEFWNAYPKKEGLRKAETAYRSALSRGVTSAELIQAAGQYATAKAHIANPRYVKVAANWLAEDCWLESPQAPRQPKSKSSKAAPGQKSKAPKIARGIKKRRNKMAESTADAERREAAIVRNPPKPRVELGTAKHFPSEKSENYEKVSLVGVNADGYNGVTYYLTDNAAPATRCDRPSRFADVQWHPGQEAADAASKFLSALDAEIVERARTKLEFERCMARNRAEDAVLATYPPDDQLNREYAMTAVEREIIRVESATGAQITVAALDDFARRQSAPSIQTAPVAAGATLVHQEAHIETYLAALGMI